MVYGTIDGGSSPLGSTVTVAQLAERGVVVPVVEGSSPFRHPKHAWANEKVCIFAPAKPHWIWHGSLS